MLGLLAQEIVGSREAWTDQTILSPIGLAVMGLCGVFMLLVPRRYAVIPMLVMACVIAPAQRFYIAGANFTLLRIMVIFGWIRVITRGETRGFRWRSLDCLLIAYAAIGTLVYVIQ